MDYSVEEVRAELAEMAPPEPGRRVPRTRVSLRLPPADRFSEHAGRNLTMRKILNAFDAAENGDPIDQCDIIDDRIEADGHLRSLYDSREDGVYGKEWIMLPGGPDDRDAEAAADLERALKVVPNFADTIEHQTKVNRYGWSASEIDWQRRDGLTVPVSFSNPAHRRFQFRLEDDAPLIITDTNRSGEELVPGKWWWTARNARVTALSGLGRSATIWAYFKTLSVRDWIVLANRHGMPAVYGVFDKENADDEDIAALKEAVQSLGRDGWAVMSDAAKIEIKGFEGGSREDIHGSLVTLCDQQNSKLINGATLVSETGGPGSFALGKVHEGRNFALISGDANRLAKSFEASIGLPFVRFNGLDARPPRIKWHIVRDQTPESRGKIFVMARNELGMAVDEDQVRQELQLRKPAPGNELAPVAPEPEPSGNGDDSGSDDGGQAPDDSGTP